MSQVRRTHLVRQFFIAMLIIASIALLSVGAGFSRLFVINKSSAEVQSVLIPALDNIQELSLRRAQLRSLLVEFVAADNADSITSVKTQLLESYRVVKTIASQMDHSDLKVRSVTLSDSLFDKTVSLQQLLLQKLKTEVEVDILYASVRDGLDEIKTLTEEFALDESINTYSNIEQLRSYTSPRQDVSLSTSLDDLEVSSTGAENLYQMAAELKNIRIQLFQISQATNTEAVQAITQNIEIEFREIIRIAINTNGSQRALLLPLLNDWHQNFAESQGYLDVVLKLVELEARINFTGDELSALVNKLDFTLLEYISNAEKITDSISATVGSTANEILLIYVLSIGIILLIVFGVIAPMFYLRMIKPLHKLAKQTKQLSEGDLALNLAAQHSVELGDMSDALTVFKNNAIDLKKNEASLQINNAQLTQANEDLERFAVVASHDLRTPLRGISNLSKFLREDIEAKDFSEVNQNLAKIDSRVVRLEHLLDALLNYSRLKQIASGWQEINVSEIAQEAFELISQNPADKIVVQNDCDQPVVFSDVALAHILRNLFDNAIKYSDKPSIMIKVLFFSTEDEFICDITDNGPGIPMEFRERIFVPFQRLVTKEDIDGSGLGLPTIKRLLNGFGGEVSVIDAEDQHQGTTFRFRWPKPKKQP